MPRGEQYCASHRGVIPLNVWQQKREVKETVMMLTARMPVRCWPHGIPAAENMGGAMQQPEGATSRSPRLPPGPSLPFRTRRCWAA